MNQAEPNEPASQQDLDAQELLELRDLQNAQIDSMKHVWDNPEDECWNDVPLDPATALPTPAFPEPYPYLTDDQYDLFDRMSEISEDAYCAGWIGDNEYNIWNAITLGSPESGYRYTNPRLLRRCKKLSDEISGWIYRTKDGPQFVPMAQWLKMFASWCQQMTNTAK